MSATTSDLEALAHRVRRRYAPAHARGVKSAIPAGYGARLYQELERDQGMTWVEALRALSYRPDAERALSAYLQYRPIPAFGEGE